MADDYTSPLSPRMHPINEDKEHESHNESTDNTKQKQLSEIDTTNIGNNISLITEELSPTHFNKILHSLQAFIHSSQPSQPQNPLISLLIHIKQLNESVQNLLKYSSILQSINTSTDCAQILEYLSKFNDNIIAHLSNNQSQTNTHPSTEHTKNISNSDVPNYKNAILSREQSITEEKEESNHTNDASEGKETIDVAKLAKLKAKEAEKLVLREIKQRNIDENFNFFESYYVLKQETNYRLHSQQHYSGKLGLKNISRLQLLRLLSNVVTRTKNIHISENSIAHILKAVFRSKLNGKKMQNISHDRFKKILNLNSALEQQWNVSFKIYNSIKQYFEHQNNKKDVEHYYQGRLYIDRKFVIMDDILYGNFEYEQMFKVDDEKASEDEIYDAENYGDIYRINGTNPSLLFKKIELECFDDLQSVLNEQYGLKIFDENCQLYFGTEVDYDNDGNQIEYISSRLIMTEYKGSTLAEKIYDYAEENDYLCEYDIGMILYKILLALQQTHRKNVIHCDLKPDNMIINIKNSNNSEETEKHKKITINLIDFGYAEIVKGGKDYIVQKHLIKGTKGYISPEIFTAYKYSKKSDIYSIGCIGFEMVTGGTLPSDYDRNGVYIDKDEEESEDSESDDSPKVLDIDIETILKKVNKKRKFDNRISPKLIKFISKLLTYTYGERYDTGNAVLVARKNWSNMKPMKHATAFF